MTNIDVYNSKLTTIEDTLALIKSGDSVATLFYNNEPSVFMMNLHKIADRVENVKLWSSLPTKNYPVMQDNSLKGKIDINSFFYGADCRKGHSSGRFSYFPCSLQFCGEVVANDGIELLVISTGPMSSDGYFEIAFDLETADSILPAAKKIVIEVNKKLAAPKSSMRIPLEKVYGIYEVEQELACAPVPPETDVDWKIAEYAASLIKDRDTIQLGIGAMPNIVGKLLVDKRDLGIHTEMFTSSMAHLIKGGVVTNEYKTINKGYTVYGFAYGDEELYDTIANNDKLRVMPNSYVNNPGIISQHDNFVSVNSALQLDLTGQICSESIGFRQFSGAGGALDFALGAFYSKNGRGIIAVHSTAKNDTVSKIQPVLSPGAIVTIPRNIVDYVITEYGVAKLRNKSVKQRVESLIAIAHPDFRSELRREAEKMMLY